MLNEDCSPRGSCDAGNPRLGPTAYRMVLDSFLLAPADHPRLLALLHDWPTSLYSLPALTEAILQRCAHALRSAA